MCFQLKSIDRRGLSRIVSVSSMLTAALPTSKPIRYQRLYALTVLLALIATFLVITLGEFLLVEKK